MNGTAVRTTCPYCGVGCGLVVRPEEGGGWTIAGDPEHPANRGRLCSKGAALGETLGLETRLLHPEVDGRRVAWDAAIAAVAGRLGAVLEADGPEAIGLYLSGQLLTEDYYVANKLAKGFIGTANVDTNSRLCMASTVAGHRRAFGADTVPGSYEDLELADLVVLVGSNLAWCHPVLFQRLRQARAARGIRVVVVDPRRTDSCDIADLHLALAPGSDVMLFNGLLAHLADHEAVDAAFVGDRTMGMADALASARADASSLRAAAQACDLPENDVARFYAMFAATERSVTVFSQGVNQSSAGTDKVNAILNVHLATGRIGRPGMGPFSVTGQPNAMGGREVGGLANQLAAHMGFDPASVGRVRRFWQAPRLATAEGLKAVEMFRAVDEGRIKALWIMATNPAVSLPEAALVRRALAKCPLVIVSDCVSDTDTLRFAHIRLPALAWGEKDGTVTNSDRTISRQRPFLPPPGEARADWRMLCQVARAMGWGRGFDFAAPAAIFREHAALSAFENMGRRDFDIGACAGLYDRGYDDWRPAQWPLPAAAEGGTKRLFARGRFFHADGRARLVAVRHRPPREVVSAEFPFRLNTGRYRDHWHTMTRTGLSARLSGHRPAPLCDIHPADLARAGLEDGALVEVRSARGRYIARLQADSGQRPGELFLPMHWSDRFAGNAVIGSLVPGHADPLSGQPEAKHIPVALHRLLPRWHAVLVARRDIAPPPQALAWSRHRLGDASVLSLAGDDGTALTALIGELNSRLGPAMSYQDNARAVARHAWLSGFRLAALLSIAPEPPAGTAGIWAELSECDFATPADRLKALACSPRRAGGQDDRVVCSCAGVSRGAILQALRSGQAASVVDLGHRLGAGTGCGSCLPELGSLCGDERRQSLGGA